LIQQPSPAGKPKQFEAFKDDWLCQLARDPHLSTGAMRVGIVIAKHLNRKTWLAYPGFARLAALTGMARSSCIRAIRHLETRKHLKVHRTRTRSKNSPNQYQPTLCPGNVRDTLGDAEMRLPSSKATLPPSSRAMRPPSSAATLPEPLRELPIEPLREPLSCKAAAGTAAVSKELRKLVAEGRKDVSPSTLASQCYRLGREYFGNGSAALIGNAFQAGMSGGEVLAIIQQCAGDRSELGDES
jgi:hypothetical protein